MDFKTACKFTLVLLLLWIGHFSFAQSNLVVSDSEISTIINNKIAQNNYLSGSKISVTASQGVVTLSGNVNSDTQANIVTELAQSTPGVKDVDTSKLTINDVQQPVSDSLITAKIKSLFIQQKLFGETDVSVMSINVETNNGIVLLSGTADNQMQIDNAIQLSKSVSGVKEVKSTIKIIHSKK